MKNQNLLSNLTQSRAALIDPHFLQSVAAQMRAEILTHHYPQQAGFAQAEGPLDENELPCADENGVLTIPIDGILVHDKESYHFEFWGMWFTSYAYITEMIGIALNSEFVKEVRLSINSPGGYVMGCFKTCGELRKLASVKKITAVVNGYCCSAAYMLAANATSIEAYPSSAIGSIGVVALLVDWSKHMEDIGVKEYAVGWPHGKTLGRVNVDEETIAKDQKHIMAISKDIEKAVELRMNRQKIEELDADIFTTDVALALGLIDAVITPEQTFNLETNNKENTQMSEDPKNPKPAQSSGTPPVPLAIIPKAEDTPPPDSDTQKEILAELKATNGLLTEIRDLLKKDEDEETPPPDGNGEQGKGLTPPNGIVPAKIPPTGLQNGEETFGKQQNPPPSMSAEEQMQAQAAASLADARKMLENK